jgi:soluble lytic murein transglycosylase-like protein
MRRIRSSSHARALPAASLALVLFCLAGPTSAGAPPLSLRLPHDLLSLLPGMRALAAPVGPEPAPPAPSPEATPELPRRDPLATRPFADEIRTAAAKHRLDPLLVAAVVEIESNFVPDAVSPKGAVGLMQLMPVHFGVAGVPVDPAQNLEFGARYLSELERRFGTLPVALAAYHAGPGAVERAGGSAPYRSTRGYVAKVLSAYGRYRADADGSRFDAPGETRGGAGDGAVAIRSTL